MKKILYTSFILLFFIPFSLLLSSCGGEKDDTNGKGGQLTVTFPQTDYDDPEEKFSSVLIVKNSNGSTDETIQTSPAKIKKGQTVYLNIYLIDPMYAEGYDMSNFKVLLDGNSATMVSKEENGRLYYEVLVAQELDANHTITYDLSTVTQIMVEKTINLEIDKFNWYVRNDAATNGKEDVSWMANSTCVSNWDIQYMVASVTYVPNQSEPVYGDYFKTGYQDFPISDLTYENNIATINFQVPKISSCGFALLIKARYDEKNIFSMITSQITDKDAQEFNVYTPTVDKEGYACFKFDIFSDKQAKNLRINCPNTRKKFELRCEYNTTTILLAKANCPHVSLNDFDSLDDINPYGFEIDSYGYYIGQSLEFKAYPWITYPTPYDTIVDYSDAQMTMNGIAVEKDGLKYSFTFDNKYLTDVSNDLENIFIFDLVLEGLKPKENARFAKITFDDDCIFYCMNFGAYRFLPCLQKQYDEEKIYIIPNDLQYRGKESVTNLDADYSVKLYINNELIKTFTIGDGIVKEGNSYSLNYDFVGLADLPNITGTNYIDIYFK